MNFVEAVQNMLDGKEVFIEENWVGMIGGSGKVPSQCRIGISFDKKFIYAITCTSFTSDKSWKACNSVRQHLNNHDWKIYPTPIKSLSITEAFLAMLEGKIVVNKSRTWAWAITDGHLVHTSYISNNLYRELKTGNGGFISSKEWPGIINSLQTDELELYSKK